MSDVVNFVERGNQKPILGPNITLICKPEQSGKTFVMIQEIIKDYEDQNNDKTVINIICCDNNLLLANQTGSRIDTDLNKYTMNGETYVEFSSHKRAKCHCLPNVFHEILTQNVKNIICCTNGQRMDDIYNLVTQFNKCEVTRGKYYFKIWLDEADKFIKFINNTIIPCNENNINTVECFCLTATPQPLFKKYNCINVFPLEESTSEKYHGWNDNTIILEDFTGNYLDFIKHSLDKYIALVSDFPKKTKWFIPGRSEKKSHYLIRNLCLEYNFAVLVVNGDGIALSLPDVEKPILYKKDDEFNKKILAIYKKHNLERFPFAITGNLCIGRGITINSSDFMLDYAILSHYSNKNEASQIAGRTKHNLKNSANYKKTVVFTTNDFNKCAIEMEKKSRKLAKLAMEKINNEEAPVISDNEFKTLDKDYKVICYDILFDSFAKAKEFLSSKEREMGVKVKSTKKSAIHVIDEYQISSRLGKPVIELTEEDRIILNKNNIPDGFGISSTKKGNKYLILPVYESENSPPKDVKFQVRYISFKS